MQRHGAENTKLKALLDSQHEWPCDYTFKFIVPKGELNSVRALLPAVTPVVRPSSKGAYVSVTLTAAMASSDAVLEIYARARGIAGIIAL